jgi:methylase of polypeptide subunit release factors
MIENKTFYPTPDKLIRKMWGKVLHKGTLSCILEPSAGQGHIAEFINEREKNGYSHQAEISCIEIDPIFQAVLREKKFKVIDSNFLSYSGTDRFDLIIANPPFDDGCEHLLKAIDIMYSGQIVFLLNAETIKNPFSNQRKVLVQKLEELNADIEYISNSFKEAERKTEVEVALIYINIERNVEDDLFADCKDKASKVSAKIDEEGSLTSSNSIEARVQIYNDTLQVGMKTIVDYYKNYNKIGQFIALNCSVDEKHHYLRNDTLNARVNDAINNYVINLRKSSWKSLLDLEEVRSRMTQKKIDQFNYQVEEQSFMDFTESNIRSFIIHLIGNYENVLTEAVAEVFDKMTLKYSWNSETDKNIHYFNGWKTNKSFYCNSKVIIPFSTYSHPLIGWDGKWRVNSWELRELDDIDKVMNYFDSNNEYVSIIKALERDLSSDKTTRIESTYFIISVFKKGTVHLTFKDENIRRRFNVVACKYKKWLPQDYGKKKYADMPEEEKNIVDSFEGSFSYTKNMNQIEFVSKNTKGLINA